MDRASEGIRFDAAPPPGFDPDLQYPVDRGTALAVLRRADDLLEESEPERALALYGRLAVAPDRDVSAAASLGAGNCLYRIDRDDEALLAWESVVAGPETPATYRAWRQIASARVRAGDLKGALEAYRQSEKRAPSSDKAEIHSRLGWLSKETGNAGAANRYFARSRGDALPPILTYLIIGVTVIVSLAAMSGQVRCMGVAVPGWGGPLELQLQMDKAMIAQGQLYRLLSVVLVHDPTDIFHLLFNMYALWYAGQLVERMYGSVLLLIFYVIAGIAGSMASYVFSDNIYAVGASGAIFGLFGIVLVATRYHHAILDRQSRAVASQIGVLIVLNLVIGFAGLFGNVDNAAHVGGLLAGIWIALAIPPGQVPTLASLWQAQRGAPSRLWQMSRAVLAAAALGGVLVAGYMVGTDHWKNEIDPWQYCGLTRTTSLQSAAMPSAESALTIPDR